MMAAGAIKGDVFGRSQPVWSDDVHTAAKGRWPHILAELGVPSERLRDRHGPCPGCGGRDRYRFDNREGRGTFVCGQGGGKLLSGDGFALLQHVHGWDFKTALAEVAAVVGIQPGREYKPAERRNHPATTPQPKEPVADMTAKTERARAIIAESKPAQGTIVERYLNSRALDLPADADIRFHPSLWHWPSQQRLPAMICPILDIGAADNETPMGAHLTFIQPDGSGKATVEKARLYLGPKKGGVVKLTPDDEITMGLAISEGVETGLAAILGGLPIWACLDAGNMADFPVLGGIESLTVVADHDKAGIAASEAVASRWANAGREVRIILPEDVATDLNDTAREVANG